MSYDPGSIVEVRIKYDVNDQKCFNVLHYFAEGSAPGVDIDTIQLAFGQYLSEDIDGRLVREMREIMSSGVQVEEVQVQQVFPTRIRSSVTEVNDVGQIASPADAQNVAAVIEKHGAFANRKNIGSFHLGGLPVSSFSNGELTNAFHLSLVALGNLLKNAIIVPGVTGATYTPCILNKEPVPGSDPVRYVISGGTEIVGCVAMETLRTMRRRTKGVGK